MTVYLFRRNIKRNISRVAIKIDRASLQSLEINRDFITTSSSTFPRGAED